MPKTRSLLLPGALAAPFVACLIWMAYDGRIPAVEAPEPYAVVRRAPTRTPGYVRIGGFERLEEVPDYEILQTDRSRHDGALIFNTAVAAY